MVGTNLDGADVGVLSDVLVLIEAILGGLALAKINRQFNEQKHHRLKGGDGTAAGPLRCDMLVKDSQGGGGLIDGDKFLSPLFIISPLVTEVLLYLRQRRRAHLENILGLDMRRRWHGGWMPLGIDQRLKLG